MYSVIRIIIHANSRARVLAVGFPLFSSSRSKIPRWIRSRISASLLMALFRGLFGLRSILLFLPSGLFHPDGGEVPRSHLCGMQGVLSMASELWGKVYQND